jgi:sec-independent protein translocase protein TatA
MLIETLTGTFAYFGSTQDWLIIGGIVLVLFGGSKIPQLAKGMGEGIREFKKSVEGTGEETPPGPPKEEKEAAEANKA